MSWRRTHLDYGRLVGRPFVHRSDDSVFKRLYLKDSIHVHMTTRRGPTPVSGRVEKPCAHEDFGVHRVHRGDDGNPGSKYDSEMLLDRRWPCRRGGSVSVRAPLFLGGIRREQARDAEGHRDEPRVDESAHLGVPGCQGRPERPAALAVRRWSSQYADAEWLDQGLPEVRRSNHHRRRAGEGRLEDLQRAHCQASGWPERFWRFLGWRRSTAAKAIGAPAL
jgi:hypothetical protein